MWLVWLWACSSPLPQLPPVPAVAGPPPLYGYWGLNGFVHEAGLRDVHERLGMTVFHTSTIKPDWAVAHLLPQVRRAGAKVTLRLTGGHSRYTDADGGFELAAWKAMLAPWGRPDVQDFVDDGTLVGHMLLDDIFNFEGPDPTVAELEEMARYSKELLPGLMVFVREKASKMPEPPGGTYEQVDAIVNQYRHLDGDVERYAATEAARAIALDLAVINGLNIANGGDGSSGQPGWQQGRFAMSPAEILHNGTILAEVPQCGMFLNWEYDGQERWSDLSIGADYFDEAELTEALSQLGEVVRRHPHVRLRRP